MDVVSSYPTIQPRERRCKPVEINQDSSCLSAAGDRPGILGRESPLTRRDIPESFEEAGWKTKNSYRSSGIFPGSARKHHLNFFRGCCPPGTSRHYGFWFVTLTAGASRASAKLQAIMGHAIVFERHRYGRLPHLQAIQPSEGSGKVEASGRLSVAARSQIILKVVR